MNEIQDKAGIGKQTDNYKGKSKVKSKTKGKNANSNSGVGADNYMVQNGQPAPVDKKEEKVTISKALTVIALFQVRIIPMYLSLIVFLTLIASTRFTPSSMMYFSMNEIYWAAGMTLLYTLSYLYKFCAYHRMFLHYAVANHVFAVVDKIYFIPLEAAQISVSVLFFTGIMVAVTLWLYLRDRKKIKAGERR